VNDDTKPILTLTMNDLASLKRSYNKAVKNNQDDFWWGGHHFMTDYVKYLIQFLEEEFKRPR